MNKDKKLMVLDIIVVLVSLYVALLLRFDFSIPGEYIKFYKLSLIPLIVMFIVINNIFKLYDNIWKYASVDQFLLTICSVSISNVLFVIYSYFATYTIMQTSYYRFPLTVLIISWCLTIIGLSAVRFLSRAKTTNNKKEDTGKKPINLLMVGAGDAGVMSMREIQKHSKLNYNIVGFIDDDKAKIGKFIDGVKILGTRDDIEKLTTELKIEEILIAMPSADSESKSELLKICNRTNCKLKIVPGIYEIIKGKVNISHIRDVKIEDLLGREEIHLDNENIREYIEGKIVLVTGGGGTIGSELCRQIAKYNPKKLLILDIYENNAYLLERELQAHFPNLDIRVIIASVRELAKMRKVFEEFNPYVIFHAAAHKHVPLMENDPEEAVKNNILGTYNVVSCAHEYKAKKFVLISTDKAVNPTNIMGATKRFCEMIIQSFDSFSNTEYVAVRFGNVLGSNGSVIPIFKKQIEEGGPITVTHPEITRFFMTIPEASQLVIQAGAMAQGGEIFVLDMGEPVKMLDVAKDLIKLSGLTVDKDIKIEFMGLRPGEKLYEELLIDKSELGATKHKKIFVEKPQNIDYNFINSSIEEFKMAVRKNDEELIFNLMQEKVPTYVRKTFKNGKEVAVTLQ